MVGVNWNLLGSMPDVGASFREGFDRGTAQREKRERQNALAGYFGGDTTAIRRLGAVDPDGALALMKADRETADYNRKGAARSAMSDYILSKTDGLPTPRFRDPLLAPARNELAGVAPPSAAMPGGAPANALAALAPAQPQQAMGSGAGRNALAPLGGSPSSAGLLVGAIGGAASVMAPSPSPVRAPVRNSAADDALMRLARADPEAAFKVQAEELTTDKARFELAETRLDLIGRLAGSAVDQPTYTAALERAAGMGIDVSSLPSTYEPAAIRAIQLQTLDGKEQLANARAERKLNWDLEDDEIDNARDDRNVGSQIETRQGQLANTRRGQDLGDARGRRGQDLADARGRRGQDMTDSRGRRGQDVTDARGRRGQDITDKRGRESASFKGTGGRGRRGRGGETSAARIVNPTTGQAMVLRNGQWVPEG